MKASNDELDACAMNDILIEFMISISDVDIDLRHLHGRAAALEEASTGMEIFPEEEKKVTPEVGIGVGTWPK